MLHGLFVVGVCAAIGWALETFLSVPIPASIVGLILLVALLRKRWVLPERIEKGAKFLSDRMALFLVPTSVSILENGEQALKHWVAIVCASILSTLMVLIFVGVFAQKRMEPS